MKKGILFILLLATGCAGTQAGSFATGDLLLEDKSSEVFEAKVLPGEPGSETISTPGSVLSSYTVGMDPLPDDPKNFYFAVDSINELFGTKIHTPVEYSEAQIQISVDKLDGAQMGLAYVNAGSACNIIIDPEGTQNWKIVAHEVLHCVGFGHSTQWESIMFPYNANGSFTQEMVPLWKRSLAARGESLPSKSLAQAQKNSEPKLIVD